MLVVGCGNSSLSGDMFDDGFSNITSMDFSELVIDEMRQKNRYTHSRAQPFVDAIGRETDH